MVAADINGDVSSPFSFLSHFSLFIYHIHTGLQGFADPISASFGDNKVSWYRSTNGVSYTEVVISQNVSGATSVYAADIDRDGDPDVIASSFLWDYIILFRNQANGTSFEPIILPSTMNGATSVFAADLNNDGWVDVRQFILLLPSPLVE